MEGLGSVTVSGDSPEAHGHRRGMGRPAEEWRQSVQRGARSQGQSLPGPSLCCSPTSEPVAALAGLRDKEIKAAAGREEQARPGQAGTAQDRGEVATECHCPGSVLPGAEDPAGRGVLTVRDLP